MINVAAMVAQLKLNARQFTAGIKASQKHTKLFSNAMVMGQKGLADFRSRLTMLRSPLVQLGALFGGLGLAQVARDTITVGATFERMMIVVKGVSGATNEMFDEMTEAALHYGETTEWTATQASESLKFLSMAGFEAQQSLDALGGTLDLATAGQLGLGESADIATNILVQMGLEVQELSRVNDALVTVQASSNTTIREASEAWIYAGTKARAFGIDVEDLGAMIGLLANAGIKATMAGTTLRQSMIKLLSPTEKARGILEKYSIQIVDGAGVLRKYTDIISDLADAELSAIEMTELFGARAGNVEIIMRGGSQTLRKYTEEIRAGTGAAKRLANLFREDLIGQWHAFKSAIEGIQQALFIEFRPALESFLENSTEWIRTNKEEFLKWGTSFKNTIGGTIAFVREHPDILEYGLVGLLLYGRKGLAAGVAAGIFTGELETGIRSKIERLVALLDGYIQRQREKRTSLTKIYRRIVEDNTTSIDLLIGNTKRGLEEFQNTVNKMMRFEVERPSIEWPSEEFGASVDLLIARIEDESPFERMLAVAAMSERVLGEGFVKQGNARKKLSDDAVKLQQEMGDRIRELTLSETDNKIWQIEEVVKAAKKEKIDRVLIERYRAAETAAIRKAEFQAEMEQWAEREELLATHAEEHLEFMRMQDLNELQIIEERGKMEIEKLRKRNLKLVLDTNATRKEITKIVEREAERTAAIQKKIDKDVAEFKSQIYKEQGSAFISHLQDIADSNLKYNKEAFAVVKAYAVAETIINAYEAAQGAYAAMVDIPYVGPVLAVAAAAVALAAGLARADIIANQKMPSYDQGGISTQPGMYYAGVPEAHIPLEGGSIPVRIIKDEEEETAPIYITLELDGQVLTDFIYDRTKDGDQVVHVRGITEI